MKPKNKKQLPDLDFETKFYEGVLKQKPDFVQALAALGDTYTKRGLFKEGLDIDKRLINLKPNDPIAWYNLACSYSLLNDIDSGLEALKKAINFGYEDFYFLNKDPDLENLRRDARFQKLAANFNKKNTCILEVSILDKLENKEIGKTKTIILSTHILSEVQASCTRAIIIHKGKIVATGSVEELIAQAQGKAQIKITLSEKREDVELALKNLPGVEAVEFLNSQKPNEIHYLIQARENIDLRAGIFKLCVEKNIILLGMEYKTLSLEDVFRQLTYETR